jgi:hypothetical protein
VQYQAHVAQKAFDAFGSLSESADKDETRSKDLAFILTHMQRPKARRPRVLSMPSNNWQFERQLLSYSNCMIVAVEHDPWRVSQGRQRVPFPGSETYQEKVQGVNLSEGRFMGTPRWTIFHADLSTLLTLRRQEKGSTKASRRRWCEVFKRWNAAWIDYTGPISDAALMSLRRVWSHLDLRVDTVPIVIEYLVGRERGVMAELIKSRKRSELVIAALNDNSTYRFNLVETRRHHGASGKMNRETLFVLSRKEALA